MDAAALLSPNSGFQASPIDSRGDSSVYKSNDKKVVKKEYRELKRKLLKRNGIDDPKLIKRIIEAYIRDTDRAINLLAHKPCEAKIYTTELAGEEYKIVPIIIPQGKDIKEENRIISSTGQRYIDSEGLTSLTGVEIMLLNTADDNNGLRVFIEKTLFDHINKHLGTKFEFHDCNLMIKYDHATKSILLYFTDLGASLYDSYIDLIK